MDRIRAKEISEKIGRRVKEIMLASVTEYHLQEDDVYSWGYLFVLDKGTDGYHLKAHYNIGNEVFDYIDRPHPMHTRALCDFLESDDDYAVINDLYNTVGTIRGVRSTIVEEAGFLEYVVKGAPDSYDWDRIDGEWVRTYRYQPEYRFKDLAKLSAVVSLYEKLNEHLQSIDLDLSTRCEALSGMKALLSKLDDPDLDGTDCDFYFDNTRIANQIRRLNIKNDDSSKYGLITVFKNTYKVPMDEISLILMRVEDVVKEYNVSMEDLRYIEQTILPYIMIKIGHEDNPSVIFLRSSTNNDKDGIGDTLPIDNALLELIRNETSKYLDGDEYTRLEKITKLLEDAMSNDVLPMDDDSAKRLGKVHKASYNIIMNIHKKSGVIVDEKDLKKPEYQRNLLALSKGKVIPPIVCAHLDAVRVYRNTYSHRTESPFDNGIQILSQRDRDHFKNGGNIRGILMKIAGDLLLFYEKWHRSNIE